MEGKLDLSNQRHDQTDRRLEAHEKRLHLHATDISALQAKAFVSEGERKGLMVGGRILWAGIGLIGGLGVAITKMLLGV